MCFFGLKICVPIFAAESISAARSDVTSFRKKERESFHFLGITKQKPKYNL